MGEAADRPKGPSEGMPAIRPGITRRLENIALRLEQDAGKLEKCVEQAQKTAKALPEETQTLMFDLDRARNVADSLSQGIADLKGDLMIIHQTENGWIDLVDRTNDGILVLQDRRVKYINHRLEEMTGYTFEEVNNSKFTRFLAPEEILRVFGYYERRMRGEDVPDRFETAIVPKTGGRIPVEISGGLSLHEGNPADLVIIRDMRENKKVAEQVRNWSDYVQRIVGSQLADVARSKTAEDGT